MLASPEPRNPSSLGATQFWVTTHLYPNPDRGLVLPPAGHWDSAARPPPGPCNSSWTLRLRSTAHLRGPPQAFPLVPGRCARYWQWRRHCASAGLAEQPLGPPRCCQMSRILFWRIRWYGCKTWLVYPAPCGRRTSPPTRGLRRGSPSRVPATAAPATLLLTFTPNGPATAAGARPNRRLRTEAAGKKKFPLYGETVLGPTILRVAVRRVLTFLL